MQRACVDIHGLAADGCKFHCALMHFAVTDADSRGMQFRAAFNVYRVMRWQKMTFERDIKDPTSNDRPREHQPALKIVGRSTDK